MNSSVRNIQYTLYVIKLGHAFLRGLFKLKIITGQSEIQTHRYRQSVFIDNWCSAVALMIRKLDAFSGGTDHDYEINEPIFILKQTVQKASASNENTI